MNFKSTPIKGAGRGKLLGYPTINLKIPEDLKLKNGIYAAAVTINNKKYLGALHFGPIPTFDDNNPSLEVFLIDIEDIKLNEKTKILIENLNYLREIRKFNSKQELINQISKDVESAKSLNLF